MADRLARALDQTQEGTMLELYREATSQGHSGGGPYPPGAYPYLPSHDLKTTTSY